MGSGAQKEHYKILGWLLIIIITTANTEKKIIWKVPCIFKSARKTPRKVLRPDWLDSNFQSFQTCNSIHPWNNFQCWKSFAMNACFIFVYFSSSDSNSGMYYYFLNVQNTSFWAPRILKCLWSQTWQKLGYQTKTDLYWVTAASMSIGYCY